MATSVDRNIRKSIMAHVRGFFQAPPAATGFSAYTVYGESDLRAYQAATGSPTRPFIFLLDSYIRPAEPLLPEVVVEVPTIPNGPFELGNRSGRNVDILVHFFGRTRGERDDLAGWYKDTVQGQGYIPIYTFTSSSSTLLENAPVINGEVISEQVAQKNDELRQEGSLDLWEMVSFSLMMRH